MIDWKTTNLRQIAIRSLAVWLLIILAEIVHGILRAILLVPLVGEFRSNQIGNFTGSAIIVVIAYLHTTPSGKEQRFFFGVFQRV